MSDLEQFWHNKNINVPDLIRIALSHYQFETIHPFLDGNGRVGRLLITLYLVSKGLLKKPSLYLSEFFEKNRASYYDALTKVRMSNDLIHWVKFFLSAVIETANNGKATFQAILLLRQDIDLQILSYGKRAENAQKLLRKLYSRPSISVKNCMRLLDVSHQSASSLIKKMVDDEILEELTGFGRNRVYFFTRYFKLFIQ